MYWEYFKYVMEHKKNVFIEAMKAGMPIHAITHDLSKLLPTEFISYAKFFHEKDRSNNYRQSDELNYNFLNGWCRHQKRNKHHWNYWVSINRKDEIVPIPMPEKYIRQMIVDWKGMSRKFGGNPNEYYVKNKDNMILHEKTISVIEWYLYQEYGEDIFL